MIVYKVTNIVNGKSYIGQTVRSLRERWQQHLRDAKKGARTYFHAAIRKYGADLFTVETVAQCSDKECMNRCEKLYIAQFECRTNGYNLTDGGEGVPGRSISERHHRAIVERNKRLRGTKLSPERCHQLAELSRGRKHTEEARRNISLSKLGNKHCVGRKISEQMKTAISRANKGNQYARGKVRSPETRAKMAEAKRQHWARIKATGHKGRLETAVGF